MHALPALQVLVPKNTPICEAARRDNIRSAFQTGLNDNGGVNRPGIFGQQGNNGRGMSGGDVGMGRPAMNGPNSSGRMPGANDAYGGQGGFGPQGGF